MKLSKTLLTILTPVAATGIVVPVTVSCGCSDKSFDIKYGEDVNCKDKKGDNYQKLSKVQDAVKNHANKEIKRDIDAEELFDIVADSLQYDENNFSKMYYELLACYTLLDEAEITLTNWHATKVTSLENVDFCAYYFTLNGVEYGSEANPVAITIHAEDDAQYLSLVVAGFDSQKIPNPSDIKLSHKSYMYSDCTLIGE